MTLHIEYEATRELSFDYESLIQKVADSAIDYAECPYEAEINVVLTDNDQIQEINREYRKMDKPTDVLSFPMINYEEPGDFSVVSEDDTLFHPETGELLLGDIMISVDKVYSQADEYGHSVERELGFLVAHSMLHLFGYDHMEEEERIIMEQKQKEIMNIVELHR